MIFLRPAHLVLGAEAMNPLDQLAALLHGELAGALVDDVEAVAVYRDSLLDDFLGEKTVEEVALELLAENEELRKFGEEFAVLAERRREEADALRNAHADAERYRYLRNRCGLVEYKAITGSIGPGMLPSGAKLDVAIDAAMGRGERS